jgi:hypothetical protein
MCGGRSSIIAFHMTQQCPLTPDTTPAAARRSCPPCRDPLAHGQCPMPNGSLTHSRGVVCIYIRVIYVAYVCMYRGLLYFYLLLIFVCLLLFTPRGRTKPPPLRPREGMKCFRLWTTNQLIQLLVN